MYCEGGVLGGWCTERVVYCVLRGLCIERVVYCEGGVLRGWCIVKVVY